MDFWTSLLHAREQVIDELQRFILVSSKSWRWTCTSEFATAFKPNKSAARSSYGRCLPYTADDERSGSC